MKIKIKGRKKHNILNTWCIVIVFIIILLLISTSYSLWSSELYIKSDISAQYVPPKLPIEIPAVENDRYTTNVDMNLPGISWVDIYTVQSDEYDRINNILTTTIVQENYSLIYFVETTLEISFTIPNNTDTVFSNGEIKLVESNDENNIATISNTSVTQEIQSGGTGTVTISGSLKCNTTVADNTYYNYEISYEIDGVKHYFYYNLIILP